ncbi:hypothetical protein O7602_06230 [Micromonospora sp. WMMD1128]|uniref:hypothetical protein n=1 Tax=unclassified Micromonospora TaxID=2617518 RepID=UPI00248B9D55|nr:MULTISPECIES: hypothetical protein [unclassified Micromonospora]WBB75125.1 hypothetical protein O7602_06230 [Micromonospora sp. WMMD1128]WFE31499.1 hypothetical protein O7613_17955 [Micromonospora sp. WMMD975]
MVRKVRRLTAVVAGAALALTCSLALTGATAAQAAPKPKLAPTGVDITGDQLDQPLQLRADTRPADVSLVIDQVKWLGTTGQLRGPAAKDLGPKYTVVVLSAGSPQHTYDLFPLAKGGPRVYRPAKQPDLSHPRAGWFFGRLNMSETLRSVGVPLAPRFDTISGGIGGGERVLPEDALDPVGNLDTALGDLQRLLLLNVGVVLVITVGLAGIALLVRRRTR